MTELEKQIRKAQSDASEPGAQDWEYGQPAVMQRLIDAGTAWHLEGSCGRAAMSALDCGACFLPEEPHRDYWGNTIPARQQLKAGTKGTLENSARFYGIN